MNNLTKCANIIFVVETNVVVRSDSAYIVWLLKKSFSEYIDFSKADSLYIRYDFVYMDGKTNYKSKDIKDEIKKQLSEFPEGNTYIIYCIDIDSKGNHDKELSKKIKLYTQENKYLLIGFYKEIEDVVHAPKGNSKSARVKLFLKKYPKKDTVDDKDLIIEYDSLIQKIGTTNFNTAIRSIIDKETLKK